MPDLNDKPITYSTKRVGNVIVPYLDEENAQRLRDSLPGPEIECLCGDIFYSTADMHEHFHLSHPDLDHPDEGDSW